MSITNRIYKRFLDLLDSFRSYSGLGGYFIRVKEDETGIEPVTITPSLIGAESDLGKPELDGLILLSDSFGNRYWDSIRNIVGIMNNGNTIANIVDPPIVITKTLTLAPSWQDTGIKNTDLDSGTYIIQLFANDFNQGGYNNNEYYSGILSWYSGTTNSSSVKPTDEIILHRAGGSTDAGLFLRTFRSSQETGENLKLQVFSNEANPSASNYVFSFKKII